MFKNLILIKTAKVLLSLVGSLALSVGFASVAQTAYSLTTESGQSGWLLFSGNTESVVSTAPAGIITDTAGTDTETGTSAQNPSYVTALSEDTVSGSSLLTQVNESLWAADTVTGASAPKVSTGSGYVQDTLSGASLTTQVNESLLVADTVTGASRKTPYPTQTTVSPTGTTQDTTTGASKPRTITVTNADGSVTTLAVYGDDDDDHEEAYEQEEHEERDSDSHRDDDEDSEDEEDHEEEDD